MNERLKLIQFLNALPESAIDVLEELCSLAGMPNGNFAGKSAPIGMKTSAILQWWESPLCNRNVMELYPLGKIADLTAKLYALPGAQFEQILFGLCIPNSELPNGYAPQRDRANALISYCNRLGMLDKLDVTYNFVVYSR